MLIISTTILSEDIVNFNYSHNFKWEKILRKQFHNFFLIFLSQSFLVHISLFF